MDTTMQEASPTIEEEKRYLKTLAQDALELYALVGHATLLNHTINTTFRVDASGQADPAPGGAGAAEERFVLRIYRPGTYSEAAIRSEVVWLRALRAGEGVEVSEPVGTAGGGEVATLAGETATPRFCLLFRWLEGRFAIATPTPSQLAQIGASLARLHRFSEHFTPPAEFERPRFDLAGLLGTGSVIPPGAAETFVSRADRHFLDEAAAYLRSELQSLADAPQVFGLIHGDLTPKNCLFHQGEIRALDFADFGWGYYPYDIAASLSQLTEGEDYPQLCQAFLEGYRRVRPLEAAHEAALEAFQICRHIYVLRWLCRFLDLASIRERARDGFPYLTARIRRFVDRRRPRRRSPDRPRSLAEMSTVQFIGHLHRQQIELWADGDRLRFSAPEGVLTQVLRDELVKRKPEVLQLLHATTATAGAGTPPLVPVPRSGPLPLSAAQERFLDCPPRSLTSGLIRLRGPVRMAALKSSLNEVVRGHEILRTRFTEHEGKPVQVIRSELSVELPVIDLDPLPAADREAAAQRNARAIARRPFDPDRRPLRLALLRLNAEEHLLVVAIHPIAADRWSIRVLVRELLMLYEALLNPAAVPGLPELPIQYADFADWQLQGLRGEVYERQLRYWLTQLEGAPQLLALPTDRPRPALVVAAGRHLRELPGSLHQALEALCQREGCTPFVALVAAFNVLLWRTTGQRDLLVGTPVANRHRAELEGMIGPFANVLVLRTRIAADATFRELLGEVRQITQGAYEHQDLPFEKLVEALRPQRELGHHPLVQVSLMLQDEPGPPLVRAGLEMMIETVEGAEGGYDLIAEIEQASGGLRFTLHYARALFDDSTIAGMAAHFQELLESLLADPDEVLSQLELPEASQEAVASR